MTNGQTAVLDVLRQFGPMPDQALVPLAQHMSGVHQSSSSIRSRRAELVTLGAVEQVDRHKLPNGRHAAVWAVKQ